MPKFIVKVTGTAEFEQDVLVISSDAMSASEVAMEIVEDNCGMNDVVTFHNTEVSEYVECNHDREMVH